eukprot:CFRG5040T1
MLDNVDDDFRTSVGIAKPQVTTEQAIEIAITEWGLKIKSGPENIKALPSYDDCNFLIRCEDDQKYLLKISYEGEMESNLILQHQTMHHLSSASVSTPLPVASLKGENIVQYKNTTGSHFVRLLTFVDGEVLENVPCTRTLMRNVGSFVGRMECTMKSFESPYAQKNLAWDLANIHHIRPHVDAIKVDSRRALVNECIDDFEAKVLPRMNKLRSSIIHNDANCHNIIVNANDQEVIAGIIDFGEVCYSKTVFNIAITIAYSILKADDPISYGQELLMSYCEQFPLQDDELALLFLLCMCRLCQSLVFSSVKQEEYPDDEYFLATQKTGWSVLESLWSQRETISSSWAEAARSLRGAF